MTNRSNVFIAFFMTLAFMLSSCEKDELGQVNIITADSETAVSGNTCIISADSCSISIEIHSSKNWKISSSDYWCSCDINEGKGTCTVTLKVDENISSEPRKTEITISEAGNKIIGTIEIQQNTAVPDEHYIYKIPVVFHVLYNSESNKIQNPKTEWIEGLLRDVNLKFDNCGQKVNMELFMASYGPDGEKLEEPGIDRVKVPYKSINSSEFMGYGLNPDKFNYLMWDPKNYLNIFLYSFENSAVLGISHAPYAVEPYTIEGLAVLDYDCDSSKLPWPQCVSINNTYIYNHSEKYTSMDVVNTMTHEIGHFLGLRHVFAEDEVNGTNSTVDSDYCTDTPTYNRDSYMKWMNEYMKTLDAVWTDEQYEKLCERTNPATGEKYRATNIMDYAVCDPKDFTEQQAQRMNHVLMHSPFVPGPKILPSPSIDSKSCSKENTFTLVTYQ